MNAETMFVIPFLLLLAISAVVSFIMTPAAIRLAPKIGAVDIPKDNRRMHTKAMPRFGGMAIFTGTMAGLALAMWVFLPYISRTWPEYWENFATEPVGKITGILVGGALIYLVGVIDDLKVMAAKVKFLCQLLCASVVWVFGVRIYFVTNHFGLDGHAFFSDAFSFLVTVIWIVGITNTINLIDGLDGLAAGVAAIASFGIGYSAYIHGMYTAAICMMAVAGAALGFLPFNFHPAKIFMGDGGSLFLGFMLASISIIGPVKGATVLATAIPVLVLGVPIFDTAFAILRRLYNKRPIMEADKGHLHHRLMAAGLGQTRSVLMLYGISGVMSVAAILFSRDLFLECFGLFALAANFIYIFLTEAGNPLIRLKSEDKLEADGASTAQDLEAKALNAETEEAAEQDAAVKPEPETVAVESEPESKSAGPEIRTDGVGPEPVAADQEPETVSETSSENEAADAAKEDQAGNQPEEEKGEAE